LSITVIEGKIYIGDRGAEVNDRVITDVIWGQYLNEGIKKIRIIIEPIYDTIEEKTTQDETKKRA